MNDTDILDWLEDNVVSIKFVKDTAEDNPSLGEAGTSIRDLVLNLQGEVKNNAN